MSKKRAPGRSLDEWMELVTECRQSGLTDAAWCNEHGMILSILVYTFFSRMFDLMLPPVAKHSIVVA